MRYVSRTAGAPSGAKSPGNTSTSGSGGMAGGSVPSEAKTPPTSQNKQLQPVKAGEHPSVSIFLYFRIFYFFFITSEKKSEIFFFSFIYSLQFTFECSF